MTTPLRRRVLIGVVVVWVVFLVGAPIIALTVGAFSSGFGAVLEALSATDSVSALAFSLALATIAVAVNTVFGTIAAWVLTRDRFRGRTILLASVDIPFAISPVVVGLCFILLFGPHGWFGPWLKAAGIQIVFSWPAMALATVFVSLPFVVREVSLALVEAGTDEEDAARTLGASSLAVFWRITLPNIRAGLLNGVLLTSARALGEFGAVLVVSGGIAELAETGTLFVFRALDDRRDVAAYAMALALAAITMAILGALFVVRRRAAHSPVRTREVLR
ncbi:MAG: sulfate ABC transporter permease subunit [Deltaproteobacteria bacterium]|nr:sulfate ABC transporter permease subunit [Deltaproteobacteria bacterium]